MEKKEIIERLRSKFGTLILETKEDALQPWVSVAPHATEDVCRFLRDEPDLAFDFCNCISGVDYNDGRLGAVYHLSSMQKNHNIVLKAIVPKENPHIRSVVSVWGAANWHEREAFDMVGLLFDGHPDPRRILCPDDWEGHALRKDYKVQEFYQGIKVPY